MKATLPARVVPENGSEFSAEIANLSTSALFLATPQHLTYRQPLTVRFEEVSVAGEVAFVSGDPAGAVLVFKPTAEALAAIEEAMDDVIILEGAGDPRAGLTWDVDDSANFSDSDDPTNTEGEPIHVEDSGDQMSPVHVEERHYPSEISGEAEDEVREAFLRSRLPPRYDTEITPSARAEVDDVESTISPANPGPLLNEAGTPQLSPAHRFRARTLVGAEPTHEPKTDPSLKVILDPWAPEGATVDVVMPAPSEPQDSSPARAPSQSKRSEAPTQDEPLAAG